MTYQTNMSAKLVMSGAFQIKTASGEVKTISFSGAVPLNEEQVRCITEQQEESNGTDNRE